MRAVVGMSNTRYPDRPAYRVERRFGEVDESKVRVCVHCGEGFRRSWRGEWCCWECQLDWTEAQEAAAHAEREHRRWAPRECSCGAALPIGTTATHCSKSCRQREYRERVKARSVSPG